MTFSLFALERALNVKKAVFVIAQDNFQDEEFLRPKEVLEQNGIEVTVASTTLNEATGMLGGRVKPDILVSDVNARDFDAVVFIGGSGATQYLNDPLAHQLASEAVNADKVVGAICIAPAILANAGLLKGKRATVFSQEGNTLKSGGADYTARPVEKDGNIITASGPEAAREFGEELVKKLLTN
jgi:protease I